MSSFIHGFSWIILIVILHWPMIHLNWWTIGCLRHGFIYCNYKDQVRQLKIIFFFEIKPRFGIGSRITFKAQAGVTSIRQKSPVHDRRTVFASFKQIPSNDFWSIALIWSPQRSAPQLNRICIVFFSFCVKSSYRSAILAGLTLSMTIIERWFRIHLCATLMPIVEPGDFSISINNGPVACLTLSVKQIKINISIFVLIDWTRAYQRLQHRIQSKIKSYHDIVS